MFCTNCGKEMANEAMFCGHCGTQQADTKKTSPISVGNPSAVYAGFWKRVGAYLADIAIVIIGSIPISILIGLLIESSHIVTKPTAVLIQFLLGIPLLWIYFSVMEGAGRSATFGKRLLGMKVARLDGTPLSKSMSTSIWRNFVKLLIVPLTFHVGFIISLFTPRKQALHDILAGTIVVNVDATQEDIAVAKLHDPSMTNKVAAALSLIGGVVIVVLIGMSIWVMDRPMQSGAEAERQQQQAAQTGGGPAMVRIPGKNYEMGKYHVTRGEFAKFVNETGYDAGNSCYVFDGSEWSNRSGSNWRNPGFTQDDNHPVVCVNWNDAQAYISWLSRKTGRQYRLPVEAEWEYACYGGGQSEYCGGSDINAVAWYGGNSGGQTHPVGQKQANGYGLYDMSGNVWQWMGNKYDNERDLRALRGGSWSYGFLQDVRAAYRYYNLPALRDSLSGFRLARTLP